MKRTLILVIFSALICSLAAQEGAKAKEKSKPVRFTFGTGILIDNQTVETTFKGSLELQIHHRFSLIENYHNLFGIYGSANTRLGLNYGVTDRLMIGMGTTKDYKLQDIQWKYLILQQTEDNAMPVSLSYYGNFVIDLQKKEAFGPVERYRDIHRLSYFTQFIVARKFNDIFSFQLAPSLIYFNAVPLYSNDLKYKNLNFGLSAGGRANVTSSMALILEYDQLLTKQDLEVQPKPNLSIGWEIGTATHTFQIFVANYSQIINQRNLVFNTNNFADGEYLVGFNITVRF
jgi:opacity protein-like surface antigen